MKFIKNLCVCLLIALCFVTLCSCSSSKIPAQFNAVENQHVVRLNIKDYGAVDFRLFADNSISDRLVDKISSGKYNGAVISTLIEDYFFTVNDTTADDSIDSVEVFASVSDAEEYYPFYGAVFIPETDDLSCDRISVITSDKAFIKELTRLLDYKKIDLADYLKQGYGVDLTEEELQLHLEYGGAPWLYKHCTIIGQVYNGYDVIEKIMSAQVSDYVPCEEIIIESAEVI